MATLSDEQTRLPLTRHQIESLKGNWKLAAIHFLRTLEGRRQSKHSNGFPGGVHAGLPICRACRHSQLQTSTSKANGMLHKVVDIPCYGLLH